MASIKDKEVIAVYGISNWGGISIYDISDDYITAQWFNDTPRCYKLYHNTKGTYFNLCGRVYLDECLRV